MRSARDYEEERVTMTLNTTAAEPTEWVLCARCRGIIFRSRFTRELEVCSDCGWHGPLSAPRRIELLLDTGTAESLNLPVMDWDPLSFVDTRPYPTRLAAARKATGLDEAVLCVRGTIGGRPVIAAVMEFGFMGGSLGSAVGELITQAAEVALAERTPLLIVSASGGARMQEGVLSLMQMAKTSAALRRLDEAGVLTISLVTDPTYGGVAASYATLCDVIIAEPGARFGFAGPRVIAQTIHERMPDGFQTAEYVFEHGLVDLVVPRPALRDTVTRLLSSGSGPDLAAEPDDTGAEVIADPGRLPELDSWQILPKARHLQRPTARDHIGQMVEDFVELHGDRQGGDCPAIVGGIGRIGGIAAMVIGTQKGHTAAELTASDFGMSGPSGYHKAARLMRLAAKLGLPVVTLVDTPGAYPGVAAEEQGQAIVIADNIRLMTGLPVPIVAVITGEGGSGGALALAVADRVLMFENSVYSVISPEGCASILWKNAAAAPEAALALRIDARELLRLGIVDAVIPEPGDGAHTDPVVTSDRLRAVLATTLAPLLAVDTARLLDERHRRFRAFGAPEERISLPAALAMPARVRAELR
jgi:acetyl-CoA carboxylase carboxyl transferase beta subunit/acetyl-CoA carboxylase carboxyl transferase alpha subunit